MRGLKHEAFIARGGFGEVHKVKTTCATPLMTQMLLIIRSSPGKSFVFLATLLLRMRKAKVVCFLSFVDLGAARQL